MNASIQNTAAADHQSRQYLTFMLGSETFAIGILAIKEIIEYGSVTEVPTMPASVRGVINLRGSVVPVMDLAVRFGKAASAVSKRTCIVIVDAQRNGEIETVGIVVDAVNAVIEIPSSEIEPPPAFGPSIAKDFLEGLGKVDGKFVILLDTEQVLSLETVSRASSAEEPPHALAANA